MQLRDLAVKKWVAGARPRTLPAAIVPVLVGTACAVGDATIVWWRLVAALGIQVGTNYANDYSDGKRGTDDPSKRVGPVRLVGWGLAPPKAVLRAALLSFAVAGVAGLALAIAVTPWLLLVGAASFAAGWLYTGGPRPYGYAGFGELFVFVFFGVVATVGSTFVQTESITALALAASIPIGFLATALLVVNNLRDIPGDTQSGKRTLAVRIGDQRTRILYVALTRACHTLMLVGTTTRKRAVKEWPTPFPPATSMESARASTPGSGRPESEPSVHHRRHIPAPDLPRQASATIASDLF